MQILNKLFIVWGGGEPRAWKGGYVLNGERPQRPPPPATWVCVPTSERSGSQARGRAPQRGRLRGRARLASFLPRGRPATPPTASGPGKVPGAMPSRPAPSSRGKAQARSPAIRASPRKAVPKGTSKRAPCTVSCGKDYHPSYHRGQAHRHHLV
uniref:Uncharacterized protein n=1 Tax=Mustela putorius furo TaxID=9669 RepID=M3Y8P1_MUSPF